MARLDTVSPVTTGVHYNNQLDAAGARSKWWSRQAVEGKLPLTLIEVQTGSYFGEDDITRYEDVYARGQGAKG